MWKESEKLRVYALLWSIWAAIHLSVGTKWLGVLMGIVGLAYWVATLVVEYREEKESK